MEKKAQPKKSPKAKAKVKAKAAPKKPVEPKKHAGGRPPMFDTPEAMQDAVDDYFATKTAEVKPFTVCGLALHLGFVSRQSLRDYEKHPEYSCIIKAGRAKIEEQLEENLHSPGCTGSIFNLKANYGWRDQHIELTGKDGESLIPEDTTQEVGRKLAFILAQAMNAQSKPQTKTGDKSYED